MNTEKLVIRPIEDADIDQLHKLLNDTENQQLVGGSVAPMSKSQVLQWLQNKRSTEDACQFAIECGDDFCGYIQLVSINRFDGNAILGVNLLKQFQGKGFGKFMVKRVHDFAKNKLLLRKIVLHVRSDNQPAIKLYLNLGYQQVGILSQHIKTVSGYVDLVIMEFML